MWFILLVTAGYHFYQSSRYDYVKVRCRLHIYIYEEEAA